MSMRLILCVIGSSLLVCSAMAQDKAQRKEGKARPRKDRLAQMDADGNGQVSLEEFRAFQMKSLEQRFKRMDVNGDGVLTKKDGEMKPQAKENGERAEARGACATRRGGGGVRCAEAGPSDLTRWPSPAQRTKPVRSRRRARDKRTAGGLTPPAVRLFFFWRAARGQNV